MFSFTHIDHVAIHTKDMEATLQFYCGILGMRLANTGRVGGKPNGRRHYNIEIGGGNAFAVFEAEQMPDENTPQTLSHLALPVKTAAEFEEAYNRLKTNGVKVTDITKRDYGKTFYFTDPNGIELQIELQENHTENTLEGDPDPVPYVKQLLAKA